MGSQQSRRAPPLVEDQLVKSIRGLVGSGNEAFGLRDDAGVIDVPDRRLVVSVDSVVAGVHVDLALCSAGDVGWKALMGALSDLAAMGATPVGALIALCVPSGAGDGETALGVMGGVAEAAQASRCPVLGGDVSSSSELVVAVTVLGTVPPESDPVPRSGASAGDVLALSGPCGGSAAALRELRAGSAGPDGGLAYRRPVARLEEGEVARQCGAHAMIDISDGLALDLHRLADASDVGFVLNEVPVAAGATLEEALGGGEDYELLIALDEADARRLTEELAEGGRRVPLLVGRVLADAAVRLMGDQELERLGWQHRLG